jgi:hypothetical protein
MNDGGDLPIPLLPPLAPTLYMVIRRKEEARSGPDPFPTSNIPSGPTGATRGRAGLQW